MTEVMIGSCSKHPYHNFVNCPMCHIEKIKKMTELEKTVIEQEDINHWNRTGFTEVLKAVNNMDAYNIEYPRDYADFKMKIKQRDDTETLIIKITIPK